MAWESPAAEEHHENVSMEGVEESRGLSVARSGGLLHGIASVKLLGTFLIAQQFTTASATGAVCHAVNRVHTKLDLIGLISTFATEAATKSLTYSALNDYWLYMTGHIGPGSLSVAAVLFEATGTGLARLFALVGAPDVYQLARLDCPHHLRYIGLKSNTECPVGNAVGACIVREHPAHWKGPRTKESEQSPLIAKGGVEEGRLFGRRKGRDAQREVKVITLEVRGRSEEPVMLKASKWSSFFLGWLPLLLTLDLIVSCIICHELFVAGLIALGTLGMILAVFGLRLCRFKYSKPMVAESAPEGDCLVVDDNDPDTLHIILGKEGDIQVLFQRKIEYESSLIGKCALFLAGSMLYLYVIASILYMPNVSLRGQILFAIANLIGLVVDTVKASKNGQLGMAKKACEQFKIVPKDLVVFKNRTAAVAFVAKHTKDRSMLKSKKLLPSDGPVWQKWWEELAKREGEMGDTSTISFDALAEPRDVNLLKTLISDMMDGLKE